MDRCVRVPVPIECTLATIYVRFERARMLKGEQKRASQSVARTMASENARVCVDATLVTLRDVTQGRFRPVMVTSGLERPLSPFPHLFSYNYRSLARARARARPSEIVIPRYGSINVSAEAAGKIQRGE